MLVSRLLRGVAAATLVVAVLAPPALAGPPSEEAGAWAQRVQVIYDAATGTVQRARLRAWNMEPAGNLEFVFEPDPGAGFDPVATGGVVSGRGKLVWRVRGSASYDRRTVHSTYVGELRDGRPHGRGRLERRSGEVLEGEWVAGRLHGKGVRIEADGTRTEATFVDGAAQGEGRQTTADGSIYEGGFRDGLRHGKATVRLPGGTTYASQWRAGVEIGGRRPDVMADALVGGLLRAQAGGGDAGKVELSVSVDQRITRQADMQYAGAVYDEHIEIYPGNAGMVESWLGEATISPNSYDSLYGAIDWEDAPSYMLVDLKTADGSRVRLDALELQVEDSQVYRKPFLSILEHRGCIGFRPGFSFANNGWGPAAGGRLAIEFFNEDDPDRASRTFEVAVADFDEGLDVSLRSTLDEAGVDTRALERGRFTCASEAELPQCHERVVGSLQLGEIGDLIAGDVTLSLGVRGSFTYSWADDRGNSYEATEPMEASLQLGAIETEVMVAEYGDGFGDPPAALRYQEIRLPSDDSNYVVDLTLRGNRTIADHTARLKVYAAENSIHRFRAVARFADGSTRQTKPVMYYHVRPRDPLHVPEEPDGCYLDDAIFVPPRE